MGDPLGQFPRVPDGVSLGDVMLEYPEYRCVVNQVSVGLTSSGLVAFAFEAGAMSTADRSGTPRYHAIQFLLPPDSAGQFGYLMMEQARAILEAAEAEDPEFVEAEIIDEDVENAVDYPATDCHVSAEAVQELEMEGEQGCAVCGGRADAHASEAQA